MQSCIFSVHESIQMIDRIIDTMIGDSALRIIVSSDFGRSVACRNHGLALVGNIVYVFLMFSVVDERTQSGQSPFFILRLIARLSTFY